MRYEAEARRAGGDGELQDLLERKSRELEESEARFRTLFESIPEIVLVHDAGGTILLANGIGARELERSSADLIGANLRELVVPADGERVLAAAVQAHSHGSASFEAHCITPSKRQLELAVNCRAFELDGRPAVVSVARDITAQRNADRQRAEFMAMVAHDIRNPLSVVVGYADMLRESQDQPPDRADMLARLVTNARAVISLVSNYLDLSRIEAGRLILDSSPVNVNLVVQSVAELYEDEAKRRNVRFGIELDPAEPNVRGDATALERVLGNLLHNSLKFTPVQGEIAICVSSDGGALKIDVSDSGPGIPADEVATIFDRYRRSFSGRAKHGSGLGLFIARALVEALGGTITVAGRPGGGSVFTVRL